MQIKEAKFAFHKEAFKGQIIAQTPYPIAMDVDGFDDVVSRSLRGKSCSLDLYDAFEFSQLELIAQYAAQHGYNSLYEVLKSCGGADYVHPHKGYDRYLALRKQFPKIDPEYFDGLDIYPLCETKLKNYIQMVAWFEPECGNVRARNQNAYKAFLLFETPAKFQKFVSRMAQPKWKKPFVTCINEIKMPAKSDWTNVGFRAWGDAFLRFGISQVNPLFTMAAPYIAPVRRNKSISLRDTWAEIFRVYEHSGLSECQGQQLIDEIVKWNASSRTVKDILTITSVERCETEVDESVPDFEISGDNFGIDGTTLKKLSPDDMRLFFMGKYTNCCEWVGGDYAGYNATPEHVYLDRTSDYYILEDNYTGDILAHSWVWRANNGDLVFDGFEIAPDFFMDAEYVKMIMEEVLTELLKDKYDPYEIGNVFLGKCGAGIKEMEVAFKDVFMTQALPLLGKQIGANVHDGEAHLRYMGNPKRAKLNHLFSSSVKGPNL